MGSYLTYALGEIVLVVIGILIALAINNYQVERNLQRKEQIYLAGLKVEFETNKAKLEELVRVNRGNYEAVKTLLERVQSTESRLTETELSLLLTQGFSNWVSYKPNVSTLTEMISSGGLKDLSDRELRIGLTDWLSRLESVREQERAVAEQLEVIYDLFRRSSDYSLRTVFELSGQISTVIGELPESETLLSNSSLMESTQFENAMILFIVFSRSLEANFYDPLLEVTQDILEKIESGMES